MCLNKHFAGIAVEKKRGQIRTYLRSPSRWCARSASRTTVNWALRSLALKKQESLGSLSRDNSRPFFVCSHCNETLQKYPTTRSTTRGLMAFVYILISCNAVRSGAPQDAAEIACPSVSCHSCAVAFSWLSLINPKWRRMQRITSLSHGAFSMHVQYMLLIWDLNEHFF